MRRYESVWVMNGDLPDEEVKAAIDKFTRILTGQEGILVSVEEWGRRKLAYKVQNTTRGFYVLVDYAGTPATVKELERNYRIDDRIIRSHTTKKSDKVNLEALQAEIAAKARAAEAPAPEAEAPMAEEISAVAEESAAAPAEAADIQGREE
ncbi:MAG: 30S ribosomal protein S6 [Deltaproteobacteria bacterium]|nr:30S ribosomal protein S6 [Deltaproteobacteria bacterium]